MSKTTTTAGKDPFVRKESEAEREARVAAKAKSARVAAKKAKAERLAKAGKPLPEWAKG